jgi:integrase
MRKSEILTLKWESIDLESNLIIIDQTNTKSKKTRRIPINSVLRRLLLEQKLKSAGSDYVFLSPKGGPYKKEDSLKQAFSGALTRAGITGLRFHDLRHTAATRMIEGGASVVAVSKILGHADLKTTMRYAHPEDSLKSAVELLANNDIFNSVTDKSTDTSSN